MFESTKNQNEIFAYHLEGRTSRHLTLFMLWPLIFIQTNGIYQVYHFISYVVTESIRKTTPHY